MATKKPTPKAGTKRARDAGTGRFVQRSEAEQRPKEVVLERVRKRTRSVTH